MRHQITLFSLVLVLSLASCEKGKVIDVAACAVKDKKLSVAFTNPRTAIDHMDHLIDGLKVRDEESITGTIDLLERFITCIE